MSSIWATAIRGPARSARRPRQGCWAPCRPVVPLVIDGLALGVLPDAARQIRERNPLLALVHHPLALETGLAAAESEAFFKSERAALEAVRGVVVTSPSTGTLLSDDYDVPPEIITVACPGTDRGEMAPGSNDGIVRLLSVGSVVPRKGFDVLIEALSALTNLPWRLTIAGDRTRDAKAAAELDADLARYGLAGRVDLLGAVAPESLAALYTKADLFVLASRFEGYGMAYAEALAHGLPVVGTTAGAIPDTVPPNAGVLVEPNDVKALTRTLRMLIENRKEREWLADGRARRGAGASGLAGFGEAVCRRDRGGRDGGKMSGFAADWLALREPYDRRARNATVLDAVAAAFADQSSIGIVDLACGTGSNFRALSSRLKTRQNWRLVDNDLSLLARVPQTASPNMTITTVPVDLSHDLEAALDGAVDLITTSALLDLVSGSGSNASPSRRRRAGCRFTPR